MIVNFAGLFGCNNCFHRYSNGFDNQLSVAKRVFTITRRNGIILYAFDSHLFELGRAIICKYGNVFRRL